MAKQTISLSSVGVVENDAGAQVGIIGYSNPTATFTVNDDRFQVVSTSGGQSVLVLKSGVALDYEAASSIPIQITATNRGGHTEVQSFAIAVGNANEAPTDILLTNAGVNENSPGGTHVATLGAVDQDAGSTFAYALITGDGTNDADNGLVQIVGGEIQVKSGAIIDFETNPVLNLTVQVTDNGGLTYTKALVVNVNDIAEQSPLVALNSVVYFPVNMGGLYTRTLQVLGESGR